MRVSFSKFLLQQLFFYSTYSVFNIQVYSVVFFDRGIYLNNHNNLLVIIEFIS